MSGRSGGSSSGSSIGAILGLIVFGVFFSTGFLFLLVWPLFILYEYIKREIGKDIFIDIKPVSQSFWLSATEKSHFRGIFKELFKAEKVAARETSMFASLPEARVNKDGSFDKRSQAGKDRETQQSAVDIADSNVSRYRRGLSELSRVPLVRFNDWKQGLVKYKTSRFTFYFTLVCIPIYELIVLSKLGYSGDTALDAYVFYALTAPLQIVDGFISIQEYLPLIFAQKYTGFNFVWKNWAIVMVVPPFLPIIPHLIYSSWCENRILSRSEIPPEVSIDNLDAYSVFSEESEHVDSISTDLNLTGETSNKNYSNTATENEEADRVRRFETVVEKIEDNIEAFSRSKADAVSKSSSQLNEPHVIWRILSTISSLFSAALILGGLALILEMIFEKEHTSAISTLIGLGAVASFLAVPYWNFKKAKKHSHLWYWQFIGVLAIVLTTGVLTVMIP